MQVLITELVITNQRVSSSLTERGRGVLQSAAHMSETRINSAVCLQLEFLKADAPEYFISP